MDCFDSIITGKAETRLNMVLDDLAGAEGI